MIRFILLSVVLTILVNLAWPWLSKLGFGRLPGDVTVRWGGRDVRLPIASCIMISLLAWLILRLLRR